MKGMILAAGIGSRLKPLTDSMPKALVEVNGKTLLELCIRKFMKYGIKNIIINLHYLPTLIKDYLKHHENFGANIEFSYEPELLDTGGGIKKAEWFLEDSDPFIVHNVDVVSQIDFNEMIAWHRQNQAIATLAVSQRSSRRYLYFNQDNLLRGWMNQVSGEKVFFSERCTVDEYAFSGIQVLSPRIFEFMTHTPAFSIIKTYLSLCQTEKVQAYRHKAEGWWDIGKIETLEDLRAKAAENPQLLV